MAEKKQKSDPKGSISGWTPGVPPAGILLAIACRKWSGIHDGRYLEVIADNPSVYLEAQGIDVTMKPSCWRRPKTDHLEVEVPTEN